MFYRFIIMPIYNKNSVVEGLAFYICGWLQIVLKVF